MRDDDTEPEPNETTTTYVSRADGSQPDRLTARELEIIRLLMLGVTSDRALAATLGIGKNTLKYHLRNILDKLLLEDRTQVVSFAFRNRLLRLPDSERGDC